MVSRRAEAPKIATNLWVRADLVRDARAQGLNLSQVLEERLSEVLRERRQETWQRENAQAIDRYNARVAKKGVFSDAWRKF